MEGENIWTHFETNLEGNLSGNVSREVFELGLEFGHGSCCRKVEGGWCSCLHPCPCQIGKRGVEDAEGSVLDCSSTWTSSWTDDAGAEDGLSMLTISNMLG